MHRNPIAALIAFALTTLAATAQLPNGVELIGRWTGPPNTPTATYGWSAVRFQFQNSSSLFADLTVLPTHPQKDPNAKLWITISIDGGYPQRIGLTPGPNPHFQLVSGISTVPHLVELRDDNEPTFGALQIANPTLDPTGTWLKIDDPRPVIEVIDDSGATGLCVLGPQSPATRVPLMTSAWESQTLAWPALLEAGLAAIGRPAIVVNLSLSGSTTRTEADTYTRSAPKFDTSEFTTYPGNKHASLVLMLGGSNDHHFGGDTATGSPITYANLSPFQQGIYDQITKVIAHNPEAKLALLQYIDPIVPDWTPAYKQVQQLLPPAIQQRMFFFSIKVPVSGEDSCAAHAPNGHPNLFMHQTFAAQIMQWLLQTNLTPTP